jgi:tetratricopeptide (TPR) repeat protein
MTALPRHEAVIGGNSQSAGVQPERDDFLSESDLFTFKKSLVQRNQKRVLAEMEAFIREKRWEDALAVFYPVDQALPELCRDGCDVPIRSKLGFILGQVGRFDEAIMEYGRCVEAEPEDFFHHHNLAYIAYNSLWAAKNKEITLVGQQKKDRLELAHVHFEKARTLRPDGVTDFYRHGMLLAKIEMKPEQGLSLFLKAVSNWESLSVEEKALRHQEKKNYMKALFQSASGLLTEGKTSAALDMVNRCLAEDEKTNHVSLVFKYYALGKTNFYLNRLEAARDALLFSEKCRGQESIDFVYEILARTYLGLGAPDRALRAIEKVPEKRRRPYIAWTESEVRCALKDFEGAARVLQKSAEHDYRSRHKSLIRLAKIEYHLGRFGNTAKCGGWANAFFQEQYGNEYHEGLFWQALGAFKNGDVKEAKSIVRSLLESYPNFPRLDKLVAAIKQAG